MVVKDIEHATKLLHEFVPIVARVTGKDITLDRVRPLFHALGNPQKKLKIVHVAGTSGKTSTSYFITSLLQKAGSKVGLTVSPHIDTVTERIQLNGQPISNDLFCRYLSECLDVVAKLPVIPSYFELLMALSYYIFYKEKVDYAVIETGMGGLHDASNIADNSNKLCVITDIGFDHMHILGNTLQEISAQKAGIIHTGNVAYMYKQKHDVMRAIRERCEAVGASYSTVQVRSYNAKGIPEFQVRNFNLALEVVEEIIIRDSLSPLTESDIESAIHTYIPARMDTLHYKNATIIMDGAHNGQKITQLVNSYKRLYPDQKAVVVVALKNGKEYEEALQILAPITSKFIFTEFNLTQDIPSVSIDTTLLADVATHFGIRYDVIKDQVSAVEAAVSLSDLVLITGSFYLIAQLRSEMHLQHRYTN